MIHPSGTGPMLAHPATQVCSTCGNELEPSGDCNACLLQLGISQAGAKDAPQPDGLLPSLDELNAQFPQLEITRLIGKLCRDRADVEGHLSRAADRARS